MIIMVSCSSIKKIPEISPNLKTSIYKNISLSQSVFALVKHFNSLLVLDRNGKIYSLSTSDDHLDLFINLGKPISENITLQNGFLVVANKDDGKHTIIDLKEKKLSSPDIPKRGRILGINNKFLVYFNKKKIVLLNYRNNTILDFIGPLTEKILNCEFKSDEALILGENSLFIYSFQKKSVKKIKHGTTASSPFLLIDKSIFFGDSNRNLISFSTQSNRIKWKYRLPMILRLKPLFGNGFVIVTPEDNNLYFITQKGGLNHWYLSDNVRNKNPILMKENVAMFFLNPNGTTIGFYGIRDKTSKIHIEKSVTLVSQPVAFNGNIYSIATTEKEEEQKIIKIGNKYGSVLKTEPLSNFHTDIPIKFTVKPVNIIKPEINIEIYNSSGVKIFEKHISGFDPETFVWIPVTEGKFSVEIKTSDKKGVVGKEIKEIYVTDVNKEFRNLLWKIINSCNEVTTYKNTKTEKNDRNFPLKK